MRKLVLSVCSLVIFLFLPCCGCQKKNQKEEARRLHHAKNGRFIYSEEGGVIVSVSFVGRTSDEDLGYIAELDDIQELSMDATEISDQGLRNLSSLVNVNSLTLSGTKMMSKVTDRGLESLSGLVRLRYLSLYGLNISGAGLSYLAGARGLKYLNLGDTIACDANMGAIGSFSELEELYLYRTKITSIGIMKLAGLRKLKVLVIDDLPIDDSALSTISELRLLHRLNLSGTHISSIGLLQLGSLDQLEELDLRGTDVGDEALSGLFQLRSLKTLYLGRTRISEEGAKALAKNISGLTIYLDDDLLHEVRF